MARGAAAPARRTRMSGADVKHSPARKSTTSKPRRVSGPAGGRRAHAAVTAPARKPKAPARKPARTRKPAAPTRTPRPAPAGAPLAPRLARAPFVRALRGRSGGVLDALLSGQGWIALVGLLLAGIVFFNVSLLELNRSITGTSQRVAQIKRENSLLRTDVARLGSSERIQTAAAAQGLLLPAPGDVRYLRVDPRRDARRAARRIVAPESVALVAPPAPIAPTLTTPPAEPAPADTAVAPQSTPEPAAGTPATAPPATTPPATAPPQAGTTTTGTPTG